MTDEPKTEDTAPKAPDEVGEQPLTCGLIMPISDFDPYPKGHWLDVKRILTETVESIGYKARLVSAAEHIGIIQKEIVRNLYNDQIVICDVSGRNANVMFELGMRLTFDKLTVIVKDDLTPFSFDTSPIQHLLYPHDLRYPLIQDFKTQLGEAVKATLKKKADDPNYSPFLKSFGDFVVPQLTTTELPEGKFIMEQLKEMKELFLSLIGTGRLNPLSFSQFGMGTGFSPIGIPDTGVSYSTSGILGSALASPETIQGYNPPDLTAFLETVRGRVHKFLRVNDISPLSLDDATELVYRQTCSEYSPKVEYLLKPMIRGEIANIKRNI